MNVIYYNSKRKNREGAVLVNGKNKKDKKRSRLSMLGGILLALGMLLLIIKGFTPEYLDEEGFLHEYFFLIPMGFGCIFAGALSFVIAGIRAFVSRSNNKEQ